MTAAWEKRALTVWSGLSVAGFVLIAGIVFLRSDMRGWTPQDWADPATIVEPIARGDQPFVIGDCLPGTIDPNQTPDGRDYGYMATMRVLACRSRSSATQIAIAYLLLVSSYPVYRLLRRWRRRSRRGAA